MIRSGMIVCVVVSLVCCLGGMKAKAQESASVAAAVEGETAAATLTPAQQASLGTHLAELKVPNAKKAKDAIVLMGPAVVPVLLATLKEQETVQSQQILEVLARLKDQRAVPKLKELVKSKNRWIRCATVYALGEISEEEATPLIAECLQDSDTQVREIAIETLAHLNDPRAIPHLIRSLRDPNRSLAESAADALERLSDGHQGYGTDWISWELWYESEHLLKKPQGNGNTDL